MCPRWGGRCARIPLLFVGRFSGMLVSVVVAAAAAVVGARAVRLRRGCGPKREFLP